MWPQRSILDRARDGAREGDEWKGQYCRDNMQRRLEADGEKTVAESGK